MACIQALLGRCSLLPADQTQCRNLATQLSRGGVVLTVVVGDQDDRDWLSCRYGRWNDGYSDVGGQKNDVKKVDDKGEDIGRYVFS